jgi:phosphoribosylformylglycinamidine cyclo-ligase
MDPLTYRAAGVDIRAGDLAVSRIAPLAASTRRPEVLGGIGAFAAFCRVPDGYRDPVLVSSTDGWGPRSRSRCGRPPRHGGARPVAMGVNDVCTARNRSSSSTTWR